MNCIIGFRKDYTAEPVVSGITTNQELFTPLHFGTSESTDFAPSTSELFSFGYDYFALALCMATSVVFSFVYLLTMYSEKATQRKLLFGILIAIQISVTLAFLSMSLF